MKLLIFDTETTGLPKNYNVVSEDWPYIVQLSWMMYNSTTGKHTMYDYIIKCPIPVPEITSEIHKITTSMCAIQGYDFLDIFSIFKECYDQCDLIIAHNYSFDRGMILAECMRLHIPFSFTKPYYCTMLSTRYLNNGKWPKLSLLHNLFFHEEPKNLHNSMIDVIVCTRCYMKLMHDLDICEIKKFKRILF